MEKTIGAFEARRKFGQLIEEAHYRKDHVVIERSGRPMAVLIPVDDYRMLRRLAKERVFETLAEVHERTRDIPVEELDADIDRALVMLRDELNSEPTPHLT